MVSKLIILLTVFASVSNARKKSDEGPSKCPTSYGTRSCNYENLLAHPIDPNKYLQCGSGLEFIRSCPDQLVFNSDLQVCDYRSPSHERNVIDDGSYAVQPDENVESSTSKPSQLTICTAEGTFPSDESESSYVVCKFQQNIVSCKEGMIFDQVSKSCVLPNCRAAQDQELVKCGSFDCSDKSLDYCTGTKKFSGRSLHEFSRCLMYSKENIQVCSFATKGLKI